MVNRKTIKEIIILVGASVILALVVNTLSPRGIPLVGKWDTANLVGDTASQPKIIDTVDWAKSIFDNGDVLFVDARSRNDYDNGHIAGAISLPLGQFEAGIEFFLNRYPPEQPIVTYCSGRTCEDSHDLAQALSDVGFTNVRIFIDGFPGWAAEGYPIE
jgi:rhodanese-related sulfurtransferase